MDRLTLDAVDEGIIYALQENARRSITDIAAAVNVSDNTVRNRIERMEAGGVIDSYGVNVDFNRTDIQHHFLFICTVTVTEREMILDDVLEIPGVLEVRTLMTGQRNVHVVACGNDNDDITRIALSLDELGLQIDAEDLIRRERSQPLSAFAYEHS
ncbi:Lrp/AsnC family transcriptional regulator [Natronobiforma cellulositropha]|uniref:Lrp/AsnC family transcriptional regulator n=1 Tax=Natronobiforma cellulositropha TaxID=1679076 RepID=UPI0021D60C3F|nr:Lrp/AsnC family transcriptional regulator [Natronobiforma cellulositropha]